MQIKSKVLNLAAAVALGAASTAAMAKSVVVSAVGPLTDDYALAVTWSNLLANKGSELEMTVVENGTVGGIRKPAQGKVDVSIIGAPHYKDAVQHSGAFKDDPARLVSEYGNMRALFALQTAAAQYVFRTDSNVTSFYDLKGKDFSIGRPGGNGGRVTNVMLGAHGINMEAETGGQYMKYGPALEQMANGNMHGAFVFGGIPHAAIDNASRNMEMRFVSPDPAKMEAFQKSITNGEFYVLKHIPAEVIEKAYEGRVKANGDQYFWAFPFMFVVDKNMDDATAYELTKTLWDNIAEVNKQSLALSLVKRDVALQGVSADIHPGAARYFKEVGLLK